MVRAFIAAVAVLICVPAGAARHSAEFAEPLEGPKVTVFGAKPSDPNEMTITPGMRAVSIRVNDQDGVSGFVLPGDRVNIMLTRSDAGDGSAPETHILLQDVRVLAVDQATEDGAEGPRVVDTVTVEVTPDMVQKLILAQELGSITIALRNAEQNAD